MADAKALTNQDSEKQTDRPPLQENAKSTVFRVNGRYTKKFNRPKILNLRTWPFNCSRKLSEFVPDEEFWSELRNRSEAKGIAFKEIETIILLRGKKAPEIHDFENPDYVYTMT